MTGHSGGFSSMSEFLNFVGTDQVKGFENLSAFIAGQKFDPYWVLDYSNNAALVNIDPHSNSGSNALAGSHHISEFLQNQAINGIAVYAVKSLANKFFDFTDKVVSKFNIQYFLLDLLESIANTDSDKEDCDNEEDEEPPLIETHAFDLMLLTLINYLASGIGVVKRRKGLLKGCFDITRSAFDALNNNGSFFENYCSITGKEESQVMDDHVTVRVNRDLVAFLTTCHKPLGLIDRNKLTLLGDLYLRNKLSAIFAIRPPPCHPLGIWSLGQLVDDKRTAKYFKKYYSELFENHYSNFEGRIEFIRNELPSLW
jgi:hypothetical protein